jgi:hypothetical protein
MGEINKRRQCFVEVNFQRKHREANGDAHLGFRNSISSSYYDWQVSFTEPPDFCITLIVVVLYRIKSACSGMFILKEKI